MEKIIENLRNKFFEVLQSTENDTIYIGIDLVLQFKKALSIEAFSGKNEVPHENNEVLQEIVVKNSDELYKFYLSNLKSNNLILNKIETANVLNKSISTIARLNNELKAENLIYQENNKLFLTKREC